MILMQQEQAIFKRDVSSLQEIRNKKKLKKEIKENRKNLDSIINNEFFLQASGNNLMILSLYVINS